MTSLEGSAGSNPSSVAQEVAAAQAAEADQVQQFGTDGTANVNETEIVPPLQLDEHGGFGTLDVDTDPDRDSAYGDDYESFTTSINSTVTDYKYEHGRRYHAFADGKYELPNDDEEANRLELQHRCWQYSMYGRLALAPIPTNLRSALDIGCGTGLWAIDFAEAHPDCRVMGTDLSPIQPTMVPPNVQFLVDDITQDWIYDQRFDYIHSRAITVGVKDWHKLIDQCWKNLEPGGWVEFQEYHAPMLCDDDSLDSCPAYKLWNASVAEACVKAGTRLDAILGADKILSERGFVEIGKANTKWAVGPWPKGRREKKVGELFGLDMHSALDGASKRLFTKILGWSQEKLQQNIEQAREEIKSGRMHVYMAIDFVWAQKPLTAID